MSRNMGNYFKSNNNKKKLTDNDIELIINNTSFDREQILDWYDGFINECPSGRMRKKNFRNFYMQLNPKGNSEKFCKYAFRLFDEDNGGYICFKEFILAISITTSGDLVKKLNLAFKLYDIDKDGYVNKKEIVKIMDAMFCLINFHDDCFYDEKESKKYRKWLNLLAEDTVKKLAIHGNTNLISRDEFIEGCLNDYTIKETLVPYI
jgi:Ca2+-binding EF-hand superfamily protein